MPTIRFPVFSVVAPPGWVDITDSLEHMETPPTLARGDGIGALQFLTAIYSHGERPDPSLDQLLVMLQEFGESRGLGTPVAVVTRAERLRLAAGSFISDGDFVRAWYVSDGLSFALVTYVCEAGREAEELADCEQIVRSLAFPAPETSDSGEV
jgi:hypothetical protein